MGSAAVLLTAVLTVSCLLLPQGMALTAISDIISALLMLCALCAFARNGSSSTGRLRWFWMLQAAGWALWFSDQVSWIVFELILKKKVPTMYPADALLFLAGAPMIAGLLLRPHRQASDRAARLGLLDFLLLLLWWLYVYVSFVVCWQYVSPSEDAYNRNFDVLSAIATVLFAGILMLFWHETSGAWKKFYGYFCAAVVFNGIAFYLLNRALENNTYFTGSWYDIPYCASFAAFSLVALLGPPLFPSSPQSGDETYNSVMANLAMLAVLSLPIIAILRND